MVTSILEDNVFKQVFEASLTGIAIIDMDGKYVTTNNAYDNMLGETLPTQAFIDHIHENDRIEVERVQQALMNQQSSPMSYHVRWNQESLHLHVIQVTHSLLYNAEDHPVFFLVQVEDITQTQATTHKLKVSEHRLHQLIETIPSGMVLLDCHGEIVFANKIGKDILRYTPDDESRSVYNAPSWKHTRLDGTDLTNDELPFSIVMNTKEAVFNIEHTIESPEGETTMISVNAAPLYDENDKINGVLSLITDITEQKRTEQELVEATLKFKQQSEVDGLTGIPNRRSFDRRFESEWAESVQHDTPLTLMLFDLDAFKSYNDTYGHQQGDDCLIQVAQCAAEVVADHGAFLARYGGEEFAVIMPHATKSESLQLATKINQEVYKLNIPHNESSAGTAVTVSVGVAYKQDQSYDDQEMFFYMADQAMYQAKEQGRNLVVVHQ
ncbi:sensor domain-containing diguanylate cyclase [Bacillus sp. FJAT-45037]|uniref:sensor domain-containing diguanylate cyclase n=1 Tax=Bacillus sp. FJAT-45037 TaxID=2011007 RepID=UPI000C23C1F2|nr:diguanylate cyclase [Bacillus sp. FJAT-45037]